MPETYSAGRVIGGRYRIVSALSQGGMGAVYLAQQISLGRDVALKIILDRQEDPELIKRFDIEARQVCLLKHPNIITYHDYGRDEDGHPYLVMEFLAGYPGTKLVYGERKTSLKDLFHVVAQMCSALHEAHQKGIVHRDLKWSNIMVCPQSHDPYFAKLIDFGIMKMATDGSSGDQRQLTVTGMLLGTPEYMSPEAICGMPIDGRADQYSLAVMVYEALEGKRPFAAPTQFELLRQHVQEDPPPFVAARPILDANPGLEEVIAKAMEKHPDDRFADILELRDHLLGAIGQGATRPQPATGARRPTRDLGPRVSQPVPKSQRLASQVVAPAPVDTAHKTGRDRLAPPSARRWTLLALLALLLVGAGAAIAVVATSGGGGGEATMAAADVSPSTATTTPATMAAASPDTTTSGAPTTAPAIVAEADTRAAGPPDAGPTVAAATAPATTAATAPVATVTSAPAVPDVADAPPDAGPAEAPDTSPTPDTTPTRDASASAERPATKPPPAAGKGSLLVQARPFANVWINGVAHGRTPVEVELRANTNANIVLEYAFGPADKRRKTRSARIKANEMTRVIVDMREDD